MAEDFFSERAEVRPVGVSVVLTYQAYITPPAPGSVVLLENADNLMLENSDALLLE